MCAGSRNEALVSGEPPGSHVVDKGASLDPAAAEHLEQLEQLERAKQEAEAREAQARWEQVLDEQVSQQLLDEAAAREAAARKAAAASEAAHQRYLLLAAALAAALVAFFCWHRAKDQQWQRQMKELRQQLCDRDKLQALAANIVGEPMDLTTTEGRAAFERRVQERTAAAIQEREDLCRRELQKAQAEGMNVNMQDVDRILLDMMQRLQEAMAQHIRGAAQVHQVRNFAPVLARIFNEHREKMRRGAARGADTRSKGTLLLRKG